MDAISCYLSFFLSITFIVIIIIILLQIWQLDLASVASTLAFAKKYNESGLPLDLLVSNAGLGMGPWVETEDGYEITYVSLSMLIFKNFDNKNRSPRRRTIHLLTSFQNASQPHLQRPPGLSIIPSNEEGSSSTEISRRQVPTYQPRCL